MMSVLVEYLLAFGLVIAAVALIWYARRLHSGAEELWTRLQQTLVERVGGEEKAAALRERFNEIRKVVENAVYAVEQVSKNESMTSEQKKELAMTQARNLLKIAGLDDEVDDRTLSLMIEAAVFVMNLLVKSQSGETKS